MPTYGEAKRRDIIESVLPSTRRKSAREDLAAVKRHNRRAIRQAYQKYRWDDPDDVEFDFNMDCDREVRQIMWTRRDGDKLGALIRWTEVTVKQWEPHERYGRMKAMLPDNTIGRHALGHVNHLTKEDDWAPYSWKNWKATQAANAARARAEFVEAIRRQMDRHGFHSKVNRAIKDADPFYRSDRVSRWQTTCTRNGPCGHEPRMLSGIDDIEAWVEWLFEIKYRHPVWFEAAQRAAGV